MWSRKPALVLLALVLVTGASLAPAAAQPRTAPAGTRRATTVDALVAYPAFFHTQAVRVRGTIARRGIMNVITARDRDLLLAGREADSFNESTTTVEVSGVFLDVGRLEQTDPRLADIDAARLSQSRLEKPWPSVGELLLLVPTRVDDAPTFPAPSIRALALDPLRYLDQNVTVRGRFRGRNLFGDQPTAPGEHRDEWVLQAADASVWVSGRKPKGDGFELNPDSRIDSNVWLEVAGTVRAERGVVFLVATAIRTAPAPQEQPPSEPVVRVPTRGPSPEVIFSTPTNGETDVEVSTRVRIQFSRDINKDTIAGHLRVSYAGSTGGSGASPALPVSLTYLDGSRIIELRFVDPPERFRTVTVELTDGIRAPDGAALVPYTFSFTLGG